jgi:hypothetical protein
MQAEVLGLNNVTVVGTLDGAIDSTGNFFPLGSCAKTYNYTGSDNTSIVASDGVHTWTQTMTYTSHVLQTVSQWVKSS